MSYTIVFRPDAKREYDEAYAWYEEKQIGLGDKFAERIEQILNYLCKNPKVHARVYHEARKAVVKKFPYRVYYYIESAEVVVISVFHDRRDPNIWKSRL